MLRKSTCMCILVYICVTCVYLSAFVCTCALCVYRVFLCTVCAYVEEAHLSGLLGGVRTDQLDELLECLLRVIPDGWVGEVGAGLLQDRGGGEMEAGGGGVGARCGEGGEGKGGKTRREKIIKIEQSWEITEGGGSKETVKVD